ncbi:hypothetical protein [Actinomadura litoris]|uniref:Uncharacterized protein n=1 Tax=Actinomadura litoris TaxID=2678616 RepID=A0A7K1LET8_9ACTN|nr:hypothetical protein [Actinomadura litoris]MUN42853.1 hypothetical protein [Actinomadura litoris]
MDAYSYTTIQVERDGTADVHVSLHPDEWMSVLCVTGRERAYLSISHAKASVTVCPTRPDAPTAGDLRVARQLAEAFAVYAAEVERLHVLNGASAEAAPDPDSVRDSAA